MLFFKKPVDYRTEQKQVKKSDILGKVARNRLREENRQMTGVFTWKFIFAIALLPFRLLWKLLDVIHLLTFVIFGSLLLYFGVTGFTKNSWSDAALYFSIGTVLVIAPIIYWLDKDK